LTPNSAHFAGSTDKGGAISTLSPRYGYFVATPQVRIFTRENLLQHAV
jgi:hypothetical protein